MTRTTYWRAVLLIVSANLCSLAHADTLRCGSQLISVGDRAFEVQQKCGMPVSQDLIGTKSTFSHYRQRDEVKVEEWIYGPNNGMYQYLRFEGGRLVRIDSRRGD